MHDLNLVELAKLFVSSHDNFQIPQQHWPHGFFGAQTSHWLNPDLSPIFWLQGSPLLKDLDDIQRFQQQTYQFGQMNAPRAYFQTYAKITLPAKARTSWRLKEHRTTHCFWRKPLPLVIPSQLRLETGTIGNRYLLARFAKSHCENFDSKQSHFDALLQLLLAAPGNVQIVLICDKQAKIRASGLIVSLNHLSILMSGSVEPSCRGQGLWKLLTAARMSAEPSSKCWLMATSNSNLVTQGERNQPVYLYESLEPFLIH